MNDKGQYQSERVDDDVPLATVDLLAGVEPLRAADLGRLGGLTVDDRRARRGVATFAATKLVPERIVDLLPGSIVAPTAENSVDGLPIREVVRKESPSAAAAQEIEELSPFYQADYHVFADRMPDTVCVYRLLAKNHRGNRFNHALVVPGGKSLDVGCGLGTLVAGMARLGMEAEGIDPGQAAVDRARSRGLKVHPGPGPPHAQDGRHTPACRLSGKQGKRVRTWRVDHRIPAARRPLKGTNPRAVTSRRP
jgi:hypothetical protein